MSKLHEIESINTAMSRVTVPGGWIYEIKSLDILGTVLHQSLDPEVVDSSWHIALPDGSGALTLCSACFEARKDLLCSCGHIGDDGQLSFAEVGLDPRCPVHKRGRGAGWAKAELERTDWRSGMTMGGAVARLEAELDKPTEVYGKEGWPS